MKNKPFVSIIVPVYNVEIFLSKCIESILNQSFGDFELILVNDGSLDNSGKICDEYSLKDSRIKVYHKENGGVSSARNLGINEAKGKWISFVDADDWIEQDYCATLWNKSNEADLIYFTSRHYYIDGSQKITLPKECISNSRLDIEKNILYLKSNDVSYEFFGFTWNKFFKLSIIKKHNIKFIEGLSVREDEIFTSTYCRYIKILSILPLVLYNYRVLNSGLTARKKTYQELLLLSEKINEEIIYYQLPDLISFETQRVVNYHYMAMDSTKSIKEIYKIFIRLNKYTKKRNASLKTPIKDFIFFKLLIYIIRRVKRSILRFVFK